jgi:gamma-glutamyltranspeptidase / glutathione hydrolase
MGAWRPAVMGRNGVVASAHPAASLAGLRVLMAGGNAVDATVAIAATLSVVEPYMSGLGGDGTMMITTPGASQPIALDFSGPVPAAARAGDLSEADTLTGPKAPLVPGSPAGWFAALERFGTLPPQVVFADAIELAEQGAPITHKNAEFIAAAADRLRRFDDAAATFLPNGEAPRPGSLLRQPLLASTYRQLVEDGPDAFYQGDVGAEMVRAVQEAGGYLDHDDLKSFEAEWQEPLRGRFRDFEIFGPPPPSCAVEYLILLAMLEDEDLTGMGHNSADYLHLLIESIKLASADRIEYTMRRDVNVTDLLAPDYISERRLQVDSARAARGQGERYGGAREGAVSAGRISRRASEHTTHFGAADASGFAANVTQSVGLPFGSAFMAGETGIMLNNFLNWTDLDRDSPNALEPGKKMENCMSPGHIYRDGSFYATIGTPGSWGILQTTPQMMLNMLAHGMNIQEAIEAPRARFFGGRAVTMEDRIPAAVRDELSRRGHEITLLGPLHYSVGGGHGTLRDPESGVFQGGADPRRDGYALAW